MTVNVFNQLTEEFGSKYVLSSVYHPESQGVLERFYSTLKNMLRAYCVNNKKNWDECIPFLMFAVRDTVQETLGFTIGIRPHITCYFINHGDQLYHGKLHVSITFHGIPDIQLTIFHPENYTYLIHSYYTF